MGNCREAMEFYKECLGGELSLQTVGGSPMEAQCAADMKDKILHASLVKGSLLLMASDMIGPGGLKEGNMVALSVNCSSEEEINRFYSKLADNGQVLEPLKLQFWGDIFGALNDKFGIRWMFNYHKNQN